MKRVASIAVKHRDTLLWICREDTGKWTLPGGHLNESESPLDGAKRELYEETGIRAPKKDLKAIGSGDVGKYTVYSFVYEPEGIPQVNLDNDPDGEANDHCWFDDLPDNTHIPNERNVTLALLDRVEPKGVTLNRNKLAKADGDDGAKSHAAKIATDKVEAMALKLREILTPYPVGGDSDSERENEKDHYWSQLPRVFGRKSDFKAVVAKHPEYVRELRLVGAVEGHHHPMVDLYESGTKEDILTHISAAVDGYPTRYLARGKIHAWLSETERKDIVPAVIDALSSSWEGHRARCIRSHLNNPNVHPQILKEAIDSNVAEAEKGDDGSAEYPIPHAQLSEYMDKKDVTPEYALKIAKTNPSRLMVHPKIPVEASHQHCLTNLDTHGLHPHFTAQHIKAIADRWNGDVGSMQKHSQVSMAYHPNTPPDVLRLFTHPTPPSPRPFDPTNPALAEEFSKRSWLGDTKKTLDDALERSKQHAEKDPKAAAQSLATIMGDDVVAPTRPGGPGRIRMMDGFYTNRNHHHIYEHPVYHPSGEIVDKYRVKYLADVRNHDPNEVFRDAENLKQYVDLMHDHDWKTFLQENKRLHDDTEFHDRDNWEPPEQAARQGAASHPNVSRKELLDILADGGIAALGAVRNPNLTIQDLHALASDDSPQGKHARHALAIQDPDWHHAQINEAAQPNPADPHPSFGGRGAANMQPLAIPDHSTERVRQLRDKVDALGGKAHHKKVVDNLPPSLKPLLDAQGHLSSKDLQAAIDSVPTTQFHVGDSGIKWGGGQQHSDEESDVFHVNYTGEHVKKLKEAGVWNTFMRVQGMITNPTNHPLGPTTIGWVRHTSAKTPGEAGFFPAEVIPDSDPRLQLSPDLESRLQVMGQRYEADFPGEGERFIEELRRGHRRHLRDGLPPEPPKHRPLGIHIDEVQSDLGQRRLVGEFRAEGIHIPEDHLTKIKEVLWGKRKTAQDLCAEAFIHHQRQDPSNHGLAMHWPSHEMKASYGSPEDTYKRLPKDLGFAEKAGKYGDLATQSGPQENEPTHTSKITKAEPLQKRTPPKLPQLGVPDDRRSNKIVTTPRQLEMHNRTLDNAAAPLGLNQPFNPNQRQTNVGSVSSIKPDMGMSIGEDLREVHNPGGPVNTAQSVMATQQHENSHALLDRAVSEFAHDNLHIDKDSPPSLYSLQMKQDLRYNLTRNIVKTIESRIQNPVTKNLWHMVHEARGYTEPAHPNYYNEKLAGLFNVLNDPSHRAAVERQIGYAQNKSEIGNHFKDIYKIYSNLAPSIDRTFFKHPGYFVPPVAMGKSEDPFFDQPQHKHKELVDTAVQALSNDLRKPQYQSSPNKLTGHCYVASEALYHLLGGNAAGWVPHNVRHEGEPHWYLKHKGTGAILDPTAGQFKTPVPYAKGRGKGFLTKQPSKRAAELISRIKAGMASKNDPTLKKGILGAAAGIAMAMSPGLQAGFDKVNPPQQNAKVTTVAAAAPATPKWNPDGLHQSLIPIAHLESSFGQNMNHLPHSKGEYHTAFGPVGFKVSTAHEEYTKSNQLKKLYPGLEDPKAFMDKFKGDWKLYNLLASSHFLRLTHRHGSPEKAAYAWRFGSKAASGAPEEVIHKDNYVMRYRDLTASTGIQKREESAVPVKDWKFSDGIAIPHSKDKKRRKIWDQGFHAKLVEHFGYGDGSRLKPVTVPVSEHIGGHHINTTGAVGPGGRNRAPGYLKMLRGGDKLPPLVVRRNGISWHVIDGNARLHAALKAGVTHLEAFELVDPVKKN